MQCGGSQVKYLKRKEQQRQHNPAPEAGNTYMQMLACINIACKSILNVHHLFLYMHISYCLHLVILIDVCNMGIYLY